MVMQAELAQEDAVVPLILSGQHHRLDNNAENFKPCT